MVERILSGRFCRSPAPFPFRRPPTPAPLTLRSHALHTRHVAPRVRLQVVIAAKHCFDHFEFHDRIYTLNIIKSKLIVIIANTKQINCSLILWRVEYIGYDQRKRRLQRNNPTKHRQGRTQKENKLDSTPSPHCIFKFISNCVHRLVCMQTLCSSSARH